MGVAVAALGSIAGGYAAKAIMGTPSIPGPDTSVPGISSATIQKGGKGKPDQKVPQVDISQALGWMQQAAKEQEASYLQGLNYYTDSLKMAAAEMESGFKAANKQLEPLHYSAMSALNEQMRMMGLDPIKSTAGLSSEVASISPQLAAQMDAAEQIRDPGARAQAKKQLMAQAQQVNQQLAQSSVFNEPPPQLYQAKPWGLGPDPSRLTTETERNNLMPKAQWEAQEQAKVQASQDELTNWQARKDAAASNLAAQQGLINDISTQFVNSYTDNYDGGYTGNQVADRISATPGYQFQMDQGTEAISREAAAKGMLGSGNTLAAVTKYGQGLAQNFYGMYMDNLSNIVAQGSPATMQIAANKASLGNNKASLLQAGGSAYLSTYGSIGDAKATSLYNQAAAFQNAAQFNATMQQHGMDGINDRNTQLAQSAMQMMPAQSAANLSRDKFGYEVFRNQQAGQQYFGKGGNSSQYYQMGGVTYPNYGISV